MSRLVELKESHVHVSFSGLMKVATLAGELVIPYETISAVHLGCTADVQNAWKVAGVKGLMSETQEGHFMGSGHWFFCSFEHVANTVTIELNGLYLQGRAYRAVALEVPNPAAFAQALLAKIKR